MMIKAWLRQVLVLCTLHSPYEEAVTSMSKLNLREKALRSYEA